MQTTYKSRTAGGILKTAQVAMTRAGTAEVFVTLPNGHQAIAVLGRRGDGFGGEIEDVLVLRDIDGVIARLYTSDKALAQLKALETKAAEMMSEA